MSRSRMITATSVLMVLTIALTAYFAGGLSPQIAGEGETPSQDISQGFANGITLALTAEARGALQQAGDAFPASDAGFSAYYRMPDNIGGFSLDKNQADDFLFSSSTATRLRIGTGTLIDIGDNFTVGTVRIINISGFGPGAGDGQYTEVNLYYDSEGWIVAYLPRGAESSRVWQARDLDPEQPVLADLRRTTLLDAINDLLEEGLGQPSISQDQLGYYHWQYPEATSFLMFGSAQGETGSKFVSFAIPENFTVAEASIAQWSTETPSGSPCDAEAILDVSLVLTSCGEAFLHSFVSLSGTAHNLELRVQGNSGAAGSLVMIIYSTP